MPGSTRTWLITGAGRGLGLAFARAALEHGDRVVGTVRTVGALDVLGVEFPERTAEIVLDVRDVAAIPEAVRAAIEAFGGIDILVNNAGYGLVGAVEEVSAQEVEDIWRTDVAGPIALTRALLPHLRARGSGHIVQISTVGGVGSMPLLGLYNAAKWALEGFSEALAAEVAGFGIRVTIAEPGGFATDWGGSSMRFATPDTAYDELRTAIFGSAEIPWPAADPEEDQGADPATAAAALIRHLDADDGPLRLLIGDDAPEQVRLAMDRRLEDYRKDPRFTG
ncbi:SDR family NAD(P)-dependent oxidoreductase [Nakamurella sp. YIM 132087]|uniref:SDR family NAD(P)-dependent oxidoreductase n=1 Tax=Nakamurella alba TaxID=2665158 RepID=A0A7K1FQI4_9ACTN|nr:SDR family NAD(P)-dependent oxidoreductase [Nakamurella alba]MTD15513.1 SDR family NAD(P)-dependent oxidoreductase [Nakamurella alba]